MSTADRLIEHLRAFKKHKGLYVRHVTVQAVEAFLHGFGTGCHAFDFKIDRELWWTAQESRGWKRSPVGPISQMEARGLSETEIMDELIEIDTLRAQGSLDT